MSDYDTPVDIGNRALQHCGEGRITSFEDDSKNASEVAFVYDKVRRAELRRNAWTCSIKKAALRPIDTDTLLLAPEAYDAGTAYTAGQVALYDNRIWEAQASSTGETPGSGTSWEIYFGPMTITPFDADDNIAYMTGELVDVEGTVYRSRVGSNDETPPHADWIELGPVSTALEILYPLEAGPVSQSATRNVFRLPNGFLREAPQDPKAGSWSPLGAPGGLPYADWNREGDYLVAPATGFIILRFVADITLVRSMDALFCEGLAARIGREVCETLTQDTDKLRAISSAYDRFMGEARTVNAIEAGPVEPPEDDYITCRA